MRCLYVRNDIYPIFCGGLCACTRCPCALEDRVQEQHCHVSAHTIALLGNARERLNGCSSKIRLEGVQLQNIGPGRRVRVSSASEDCSAHLRIGNRIVHDVSSTATDEVLRMFDNPRMVRSDVVRYEIQDQVHSPLRELTPGNRKAFRASEIVVDYIAVYTIWRPDVVFGAEIRKGSTELSQQILVLVGNCNPRRTALPNAHKPHRIEAERGDRIPLGRRHTRQVDVLPILLGKFRNPRPGIDLV